MAIYYVDDSIGDDSRTPAEAENISTPWLTIQKGADNVVAGDIKITAINGGTAVLLGVPAGTWIDRIRVRKVWATGGTTATSIIVAW